MVTNGFPKNVLTHEHPRESCCTLVVSRATTHRSLAPLPCPRYSTLPAVLGDAWRQQNVRQRRCIAAAVSAERGPGGDEGDPALQDNLVSMLRLQIGKKHVDAFVDAEEEKLKQSVEEAKAEFDDLGELTRQRSNLSFDSALADINQSADEFEAQLLKSRRDMERAQSEDAAQADQANFADWEDQMAEDRSEGHFFKSLYQKQPRGAGKGGLQDPMGARIRVESVQSGAAAEVHSPLRMYIFSFLAAVLLITASVDAVSESPSTQRDVLYGALGAAMGATALWERSAFPAKGSQASPSDGDNDL